MLAYRMYRNNKRIKTGTSFKTHLAMALKLLEMDPQVKGDVIECGTWNGGCAANLSIICKMTGRKLRIFDSFQGLPKPHEEDREGHYSEGDFHGPLETVKENIRKYGHIDCCEFVQGWFKDTLHKIDFPIVMAFVDVDLEESLDQCVRGIWPNLVQGGYLMIDEVVSTDYCSIFYSEKYWDKYFGETPPGMIGAGSGLPLGDFYIGPYSERGAHPTWHPHAGAFTQKGMSGHWTFYADEIAAGQPGK